MDYYFNYILSGYIIKQSSHLVETGKEMLIKDKKIHVFVLLA